MTVDEITEVGIDLAGRLLIKPRHESFDYIWRSAAEVHWDSNGKFLYSPKPREWNYSNWYQHILMIAIDEYGCKLILTNDTKWVNISDELKKELIEISNSLK